MNTADKLTASRIGLTMILLFLLLFSWQDVSISFPTFLVAGKIVVDSKYLIAGVLFLIAIVTDLLDGFFAKSEKNSSDFGKIFDFIVDKILINGVLITLVYNGFISVLIPIIVMIRDFLVSGIRILVAKNGNLLKPNKYQKIKTICMYLGILLTLFYNLPFEIFGIYVSEILLDLATILSVVTGYFYYMEWREKYKKLDEKI